MKKLLIVALGLGMMAGQTEAKLNITMESATGLLKAVEQLPENIITIKNKSVCAIPGSCTDKEKFSKDKEGIILQMPTSLEGTYYSLAKKAQALKVYKSGDLKGQPAKKVALYKITQVNDVIDLVVTFLTLSLEINTIIKDKIILPILEVAGQQSLIAPLTNVGEQIKSFKNTLDDVNTQVKDILELVKLLS